jgi:hypothetical protein
MRGLSEIERANRDAVAQAAARAEREAKIAELNAQIQRMQQAGAWGVRRAVEPALQIVLAGLIAGGIIAAVVIYFAVQSVGV